MKKFLLFALFTALNAIALSPEQLRKFSRQENLTESQIAELTNSAIYDFANAINYQHAITVFDKNPFACLPTNATKQQMEAVRNTILIRSSVANSKLKDWQIAEMDIISREPKKSEETAISKFVRALNLPFLKLNRVRIVDGSSYINGLFLDRGQKDCYLSFLSNLEADLPLKNSLSEISKTDFNRVVDQTRNSLTYRTLMLSFLARNEANLPISARYPVLIDGKMIIRSENQGIRLASKERSYIEGNELGLNLSDVRLYNRTLFASSYSSKVLADGTYPFLSDTEFDLFHEIGHYIDHAPSNYFWETFIGGYCSPAAAFLNLDTTNIENKLAAKNLPRATTKNDISNLSFLARMHFDSSYEIWQILGFKLLLDSKETWTLYINKMSDFSLSCELGMPIRMDHTGIGISHLQMLLKPGTIVEAKYRIPLEAYGTLMEVYGYSLCGYVVKLMYPYGLSSLLKNEYRLNSVWIKKLVALRK